MTRRVLAALLALTAAALPARADKSFTVTVVVTDPDGEPVAKADAALFWNVKAGAMVPGAGVSAVTDAAGKATLTVGDWNEKRPLLVLSADRKLGGYAGVSRADAGKTVPVTLGPTVKVKAKLACPELGITPKWANTTVAAKGFRAFNVQHITEGGEFTATLPEGDYTLNAYGTDVVGHKQALEVEAGRSEIDLGTISLKASPVAKLRGKVPPAWAFEAARGVDKSVKLADFKGKWVYVAFWGHWCGPCVAGELPELIGLVDDHAEHRDRFQIIAVHDSRLKTFAELDPLVAPIKARYWHGRDLPFPVVIDAEHKTETVFGVAGWPTGLLIDPDGKLVGEAGADEFEAKLPPVSAAKKWARHRAMSKHVAWDFGPDTTPARLAKTFTRLAGGLPVALDGGALKAAGLTPDSPLGGLLVGSDLTLGDVEELLLAPRGLGVVPTADGNGLTITARPGPPPPPTPGHARREQDTLARLAANPPPEGKAFDLPGVPLAAAVRLLANEFDLPMAVDAKALDPAVKLSGKVGRADVRTGVAAVLAPHGLAAGVRRGVVVVRRRE